MKKSKKKPGRYVRAPKSPEWDNDEYECTDDVQPELAGQKSSAADADIDGAGEDGGYTSEAEDSVHGTPEENGGDTSVAEDSELDGAGEDGGDTPEAEDSEPDGSDEGRDDDREEPTRTNTVQAQPPTGAGASSDRLQRIEEVLAALTDKLNYMERAPMVPIPDSDRTWSVPNISTDPPGGHSMGVRCDNIKPFPSGVPDNKLWETWNGYIEIFEMSANLGNVRDPVQRSQLLFLSVGQELQGIISAAKLRPSLDEPGCYQKFVTNIHNYFRKMMDPAAEHENFSNMRQGKSESALAFHARLTSKVRLCGYNPGDHEMFVRSQLLKGLRNKELARNARIYGQATNDVVLSAGRSDCIEAETTQPPDSSVVERPVVYTVRQQKLPDRNFNGKRKAPDEHPDKRPIKQARQGYQVKGRRSRCARCGGIAHTHRPCPAAQRTCAACGERGHYAAVCREARIRQVKKNDPFDPEKDDEEQVL